jgi:hypothetical protein
VITDARGRSIKKMKNKNKNKMKMKMIRGEEKHFIRHFVYHEINI